jgi:hypothetical protein
MTLTFMKTHSCGSDYIVVNMADISEANAAEMARRLCTQPLGVGADCLAVVEHLDSSRFIVQCHNPDGTDSPADGGALRCCARTIEIRYGYCSATFLTGNSTYESRVSCNGVGLRFPASPASAGLRNTQLRMVRCDSPGAAEAGTFADDIGKINLATEGPFTRINARSRSGRVGPGQGRDTTGPRARTYDLMAEPRGLPSYERVPAAASLARRSGVRDGDHIGIEAHAGSSLDAHTVTDMAQGTWLYSPAVMLFEGEFPWP